MKERMMRLSSNAAGMAALSVCESILLSLTENNIIYEAEAILEDAATAHRGAVPLSNGAGEDHAEVAGLLKSIIAHGNSVRHADRPDSD